MEEGTRFDRWAMSGKMISGDVRYQIRAWGTFFGRAFPWEEQRRCVDGYIIDGQGFVMILVLYSLGVLVMN